MHKEESTSKDLIVCFGGKTCVAKAYKEVSNAKTSRGTM